MCDYDHTQPLTIANLWMPAEGQAGLQSVDSLYKHLHVRFQWSREYEECRVVQVEAPIRPNSRSAANIASWGKSGAVALVISTWERASLVKRYVQAMRMYCSIIYAAPNDRWSTRILISRAKCFKIVGGASYFGALRASRCALWTRDYDHAQCVDMIRYLSPARHPDPSWLILFWEESEGQACLEWKDSRWRTPGCSQASWATHFNVHRDRRPARVLWSATIMSSSGSGSKTEFQVGGKYRLVRKIGSGSFGDIYLGVNITNGEVWIINALPSAH